MTPLLPYDTARCRGTDHAICQLCRRREPGYPEWQVTIAPPIDRATGECGMFIEPIKGCDGEGAKAITSDVITMAMEFASLLPSDVPVPQVAPETDGQITFEWFRDSGNVFTVSIYPSRKLGFAGVHGGERFSSVTLFDGSSLPAQVIEFARRTAQP